MASGSVVARWAEWGETSGAVTATDARTSDFVLAISVAAVLHGLVFLIFVGLVAMQLLSRGSGAAFAPPPEPTVTVEIRPEMFERPKPSVVEEEVKKRLKNTSPAQESQEAPENAVYIGERNTKAASEMPPDPNGPALPSQDGREPRRPDEVETIDSNFQDGEEPDVAMQPESEQVPPPGETPREPAEPDAEPNEKPGEEPPPGGEKKSELMKTETQVPVPRNAEEDEERDAETLPKEKESESDPQSKNTAGGAPETKKAEEVPPPKNSGFETEARKTRLRGSIGRKGTTALDVEDSPIGRYQAKLSRAVERQWQMNCIQYREHITPGFLTIRFLVDEKGRVSGARFLEVMENGEIQQGFTLKSIQTADIPTMPKEIVKELNGDPLELIYNFYF